MKISATIITHNEERNLPRAIESLRCADEILVMMVAEIFTGPRCEWAPG